MLKDMHDIEAELLFKTYFEYKINEVKFASNLRNFVYALM